MSRAAGTAAPAGDTPLLPEREHGLSRERLVEILSTVLLTRATDRRLQALYKQGRVYGGVYSQEGNEGISVGAASALEDGDCLFPMHRGLGARLLRGDRLEVILAQLLARGSGPTAGRDSGLHHDVPERRIFAMISHLGTQLPVACGAALALRQRGEDRVALSFTGDGATALGDFHEGYNMAAVLKLPVVLVVENNLYAYSTPNEGEFACGDLAARGAGYGTPAVTVDGTDLLAVREAVLAAGTRARAGGGPSRVEARALRLRGHSEADDHAYVPAAVLAEGRRLDPVARLVSSFIAWGVVAEADVQRLREDADERLEKALEHASALAPPDASDGDYGRWSEEGHPSRGRGVPGVPGLAGAAFPRGKGGTA